MNWKRTLAFLAVLGAVALAQTQVDQGRPGKMGPWPVVLQGSSTTDGGAGTNAITPWYPAATTTSLSANATPCTTAGGASCTTIQSSIQLGVWTNVTITLLNGGANAITNVLVEWSPDNTNWEVWDSTTFAAIAAGAQSSIAISGNSRRYLRMEARAAANTSATVTITANDG